MGVTFTHTTCLSIIPDHMHHFKETVFPDASALRVLTLVLKVVIFGVLLVTGVDVTNVGVTPCVAINLFWQTANKFCDPK